MIKKLLRAPDIEIGVVEAGKGGMIGIFVRCRRPDRHYFTGKMTINTLPDLAGQLLRDSALEE